MDTITSSGKGRLEYEPNVFNQYETLTYPSSSTVEPAYNADGDMTDDGNYAYTYDGAGGAGGLLAETNSSGAWCFAYDGNGNIVNVLVRPICLLRRRSHAQFPATRSAK